MTTLHKHYDLIIAWASGVKIQRYNKTLQQWRDCDGGMLDWNPHTDYRVKPEPKPDVVLYKYIHTSGYTFWRKEPTDDGTKEVLGYSGFLPNLKLILDGETGKLKSAEVI
jgi:hypothetical protein